MTPRVLGLALALLSTSALAAPEQNPFLAEAKVLYHGLEYARCSQRVKQARDWENTRNELAEIELYAGLCAYGLTQSEAAAHHFALARGLRPDITLPPHTSPKIRELFEAVARAAEPEETPAPTAPSPSPSPGTPREGAGAVAAAPSPKPSLAPTPSTPARAAELPAPAVPRHPAAKAGGRSHTVPLVLASTSAAAVLTGIVFGLRANSHEEKSRTATFESDSRQAGITARQSARNANIAYGLGAGAGVAAALVYLLTPTGGEP